MMFIMMLVGLGMVLGNLFSGRISGRYSPLRIAAMTNGVIVAVLLLIFAFGIQPLASLVLAFICCAGLSRSPRRCKYYCYKMPEAAKCSGRRAVR